MHGNVIAANSTPPGKGGVAVIRMSGDGALEIAKRVFLPFSGKSLDEYRPRTQIYGYILYNGEKIDDGMLTYFPAPRSYTGEDTVEISCHGGILVTRTVLEALFAAGAVPAEAGEFTRRAFINGKLSLSEAEAIGTLLEATSHEQIRLSASPARAKLQEAIDGIRTSLIDVMSSIYARIDYPDEDLGEFSDEETVARLLSVRERLAKLIDTYKTGRAINEGISTVIAGKPNVGKSTLYNLLVGEDAAIVTDIAGTTRDILERTVALGRVTLRLTDTAGVRSGELDKVEEIGIGRSKDKITSSELILAVFDLSREIDKSDLELIDEIAKADGYKVCVLNKCDLVNEKNPPFDLSLIPKGVFGEVISISADKDNLSAIKTLTELINRLFTDEKISCGQDAIVSSARQHASLLRARSFIDTAIEAYRVGIAADAASSDVEMAIGAISELDGRAVSDSVVSDIFAKFCVGK
ncbi:MAG: tRNA uridine-5-carboxymethylaminomethyl(34) synthesis GTPase MnmE [Clostridia bacterium]|nr:tRNA uridine-5-carboxymethylaminomethyl(34) synthesis GTPase MnmE [Clostridia bacterium]